MHSECIRHKFTFCFNTLEFDISSCQFISQLELSFSFILSNNLNCTLCKHF